MIRKGYLGTLREKREIIEVTLEDLRALHNNLANRILGSFSEYSNDYSTHDQIREKMDEIGKMSDKVFCRMIPLSIITHYYLTMHEVASKREKLRFLAFLRGNPLEDLTTEELSAVRNNISGLRDYFEAQEGRYDEYVHIVQRAHENLSEDERIVFLRVDRLLFDIELLLKGKKIYGVLCPPIACIPGA